MSDAPAAKGADARKLQRSDAVDLNELDAREAHSQKLQRSDAVDLNELGAVKADV